MRKYRVTVERLTGETFQIDFGKERVPFYVGEIITIGGGVKAEVKKKSDGTIYWKEIKT